MTHFGNNLHHIRQRLKYLKTKLLCTSLGAGTHKGLNRMAKISLDQLYMREENLSFNKNGMIRELQNSIANISAITVHINIIILVEHKPSLKEQQIMRQLDLPQIPTMNTPIPSVNTPIPQ